MGVPSAEAAAARVGAATLVKTGATLAGACEGAGVPAMDEIARIVRAIVEPRPAGSVSYTHLRAHET